MRLHVNAELGPTRRLAPVQMASDATHVNGHRFLPGGGYRISPAAAIFSPRWWPSVLSSALSSRSREVVGRAAERR
jgi:hypothetical protein